MPQSKAQVKSQAREELSGDPIPVVRDEGPRRADFDEFDPNAPVGAEEPSSGPGTYEEEDEREEQANERINSSTKIPRDEVQDLKDSIGGGATVKERTRPNNQFQKPYKPEKELDEAFD